MLYHLLSVTHPGVTDRKRLEKFDTDHSFKASSNGKALPLCGADAFFWQQYRDIVLDAVDHAAIVGDQAGFERRIQRAMVDILNAARCNRIIDPLQLIGT